MQRPWDLLKRVIDTDTFSLLKKQRKSLPEKITQKRWFESPKNGMFPCYPPNGCTPAHAHWAFPKPPFWNISRQKTSTWRSYSSEISKESSRWLRDVSSQYQNNILQTQRPSGILAVMAIAIGKAYFLRRRFLLHRWRAINSFVCNEFDVRKRKMIFPGCSPLIFFLTWISFCHQWVFNKSRTDDFFNRRGCRGMTAAGGSSGTTSHASSIFSLFFSLVIPLIHSTLDCMTQLKL